MTGLAIGYAADPESMTEEFRKRDESRRPRKPLAEMVFSDRWGTPAGMFGD